MNKLKEFFNEAKYNKQYQIIVGVVVVGLFSLWFFFGPSSTTSRACNGWSERIADTCLDFDWSDKNNKTMTISMKDISGNWEQQVTHKYIKEEKSIKFKNQMMDKLITKDLSGWKMILIQDGDGKMYRLSIGGMVTDNYYFQ